MISETLHGKSDPLILKKKSFRNQKHAEHFTHVKRVHYQTILNYSLLIKTNNQKP